MDDLSLRSLCAMEEANLEPDDGVAAIDHVVNERIRLRYHSDGTPRGTIEAHDQFSWVGWAMVGGHYTEVAKTFDEVQARVQHLLEVEQSYRAAWARAARIVSAVEAGTYHGPDFDALAAVPGVVNYANLDLCAPAWATPDKFVRKIGHHSFYRA